MEIAIDRIEMAARKFAIDDDRVYRSGPFEDVVAQLGFEIDMRRARKEPDDATALEVLRQFRFIQQDVWSIETLCERLEWQRGLWNSETLDGERWIRFAAADIILFHMEYRSIFDYIARTLALLADKPGQVSSARPGDDNDVVSFEKLAAKAATKSGFASKLGNDIVHLFQKCDWFTLIRYFRNLISHYGGETMVFLDKPEIQFQIYDSKKNYDRKVMLPGVMSNANVARFDLYAGVFYGYLLWYLDECAPTFARRLRLNVTPNRSRTCHSALSIMQSWMSKAIVSAGKA